MKKISIIVPVYKVEKYLDKCVESLVNQTYKNLEIILVDDGSPDECPKICDAWAKKDSRIKVSHKANGGLSEARNTGMDIATGDYIGFVDSDDYVSEEMYNILVKIIEENDADISACQESTFNDENNPRFTVDNNVTIVDDVNAALNGIINSELVLSFVWNKLYKKELLNDIRFPVGKNYEDVFTLHKIILKTNKIAVTSSALYAYRKRKDNITKSWTKKNICDFIEANNLRYNDLKDNKKVIDSLNAVRLRSVYTSHVAATLLGDKDFYNSELLKNDYKFLKKKENFKYYKAFVHSKAFRIMIMKNVLLLNRNLFWKIRTRKR